MNPTASDQKKPCNSQPEPIRTRVKLLKLPWLVQKDIFKSMCLTDSFTMSLCSMRMYNLIKNCKIKIARLLYREYKNGFWIYNRLDKDNKEYIVFVSAVERYKHESDETRVTYGGVNINFQWRRWGIEYIDKDYGPIQKMTQNHINGLFQLSDIDLELWPDNLQQGHCPKIRNVTDILFTADNIKSKTFLKILRMHPNLKSVSLSHIDRQLPLNSILFNVEEVAIRGFRASVRSFLNYFSGKRVYLPLPDLSSRDIIDCVIDWISGRKLHNLSVLHIGVGLMDDIVSDSLRPLAKNTVMPDKYESPFRFIGYNRNGVRKLPQDEDEHFLHFERETDQKMATLVYSESSSTLLSFTNKRLTMNPPTSVQKPPVNAQARTEPVRKGIKLLKFPYLVQKDIFKSMRYTDIFTMSLCSSRMYNSIRSCKLVIARLCYKEYKNGFWVYNRLDEEDEYIIFVSAVEKYKQDKDQIRVNYGGVSVDFQWRRWGIEYIDKVSGRIQRMTQNHINGLFQLSNIDLELWPDNLKQGLYPDIRDVTDILIQGDKINLSTLDEILQMHPNLKSVNMKEIEGAVPADSLLFKLEEVSMKGGSVRSFLDNFSGNRAELHWAQFYEKDVIDFVKNWISGRKYQNLTHFRLFPADDVHLYTDRISNSLFPLAKDNDTIPDPYESLFRYIRCKTDPGRPVRVNNWLNFERATDQKMATLVYCHDIIYLFVWN